MKLKKRLISKEHSDYEAIGSQIQSTESVVGIDARHTHIIIIKKLLELEERMDSIEKQLKKQSKKPKKK
ncbi:MAG: hypothetical protein L6Q51_08160 [Cyclobacteriaceae bacterium]|nr:hypothetical protein [Cyclobacteriaceae bacterium]